MSNVTYTGTLIRDLQAMVEKYDIREQVKELLHMAEEHISITSCEYLMGTRQSDPGAGEPCGRTGIYREQCGMVLCDRCYRRMQ